MTKARPVIERLLAKIQIDPLTDCWIWLGCKTKNGYGRIIDGTGRGILTHCLSYEHFVGPIPIRTELHHTCDRRACANFNHLKPLTRLEHTYISPHCFGFMNAAKTHCVHGHEFSIENTYWTKEGWRRCRKCRALSMRK